MKVRLGFLNVRSLSSVEVRNRGSMVYTQGESCVVNTHGHNPEVNTYGIHTLNTPKPHVVHNMVRTRGKQ
jgi:hypothetical protein